MVTFKFRIGMFALGTLLILGQPASAPAATAAACSICATDCYDTYSDDLDTCSWRLRCQEGARAEKDACLGNCIIDGCGDFQWFPKPGETTDGDFWDSWLI